MGPLLRGSMEDEGMSGIASGTAQKIAPNIFSAKVRQPFPDWDVPWGRLDIRITKDEIAIGHGLRSGSPTVLTRRHPGFEKEIAPFIDQLTDGLSRGRSRQALAEGFPWNVRHAANDHPDAVVRQGSFRVHR